MGAGVARNLQLTVNSPSQPAKPVVRMALAQGRWPREKPVGVADTTAEDLKIKFPECKPPPRRSDGIDRIHGGFFLSDHSQFHQMWWQGIMTGAQRQRR